MKRTSARWLSDAVSYSFGYPVLGFTAVIIVSYVVDLGSTLLPWLLPWPIKELLGSFGIRLKPVEVDYTFLISWASAIAIGLSVLTFTGIWIAYRLSQGSQSTKKNTEEPSYRYGKSMFSGKFYVEMKTPIGWRQVTDSLESQAHAMGFIRDQLEAWSAVQSNDDRVYSKTVFTPEFLRSDSLSDK